MNMLQPDISSQEQRNRLRAVLLKKRKVHRAETQAIQPRPVSSPIPLSFAQERLWLLHQLEPESSAYNISTNLRFIGPLDVESLQRSLNKIVRRHESLRTRFPHESGHARQEILGDLCIDIERIDLSHFSEAQKDEEVLQLARQDTRTVFDLARGPLLRVKLLRLEDTQHVLLVTMHHIICDGWSIGIMVREFVTLYQAYTSGQPPALPEPQLQYGDYAVWQRERLHGEALDNGLSYWRKQLAQMPALELPVERSRLLVNSEAGASLRWTLSETLSRDLRELSRREEVTLFMLLLSSFQLLLARYSGQDDVAVGTTIAGRGRPETESLIGFFANTLVLRTVLSGDLTFRDLLAQVRETTLEAYAHQDVPFEKLVEMLSPERDAGKTPLVQVFFDFENTPQTTMALPGLEISGVNVGSQTEKFDLTLTVMQSDTNIGGRLGYRTGLFGESRMRRMLSHFETLLNGIVSNPQARLDRLSMLTASERRQVLEEWNRTEQEFPSLCVHELFERQAARSPEAIALRCAGRQLSYAELNQRANQLAHHLHRLGVGVEDRVGICLQRSLEMVVALLGVLKAGAAYVPLDPEYPRERLEYILQNIGAKVVLTDAALGQAFSGVPCRILCVDREWDEIAAESAGNLQHLAGPENLAYVIYTSGSTGKPKGAMNTHRGICNRLLWIQQQYALEAGDVVLQKTPFSFDVSVCEFFWPLLSGARLVMAQPGGHRDSAYLADVIESESVTTIHFVPSMLAVFVEQAADRSLHTLRRVMCSGEALSRELVDRCRRQPWGAKLHNLYGPTEAAVEVTYWPCGDDEGSGVVPIGKPISNIQMYVLDRAFEPLPAGVGGEIYIGGVGVGRGYWGQAGLTAERFVPHPFSTRGGERLYRTGDIGRWREDGNLEYLGRADQQVKLRGYRIELGEIEAALREDSQVRDAAVLLSEQQPGDKLLISFVVPHQDGALDMEALEHRLRHKLPAYMVPPAWAAIDALPVTPNGKLDRRALLQHWNRVQHSIVRPSEPPRDDVERELKRLWMEELGLEDVGIRDNFFSVGGHSLKAVLLAARMSRAFNRDVYVRLIVEKPTIEEQALVLRGQTTLHLPTSLVPLQRTGIRRPLFLAHSCLGLAYCYQELVRLLGPDQPVYGLQCCGLEEGEEPLTSIPEMAAAYIAAMRVIQPSGPYQIAGWSMGGLVVFEMAQQLTDAGETVSFLGLMEARIGYTVILPKQDLRLEEWENLVAQREQKHVIEMAKHELDISQAASLSPEQFRRLLRVIAINQLAIESYRVERPYSGDATLLRAPIKAGADPNYGWTHLVLGRLQVIEIPGTHDEFMAAPSVAVIADTLARLLGSGAEQATATAALFGETAAFMNKQRAKDAEQSALEIPQL